MIPAGYRDGVAFAKTATEKQVADLEEFGGTLGVGPTPLEQVYYVLFPDHEGQWDKAAQFWSEWDVPDHPGEVRPYPDDFISGVLGDCEAAESARTGPRNARAGGTAMR